MVGDGLREEVAEVLLTVGCRDVLRVSGVFLVLFRGETYKGKDGGCEGEDEVADAHGAGEPREDEAPEIDPVTKGVAGKIEA